MRRRLAIMAVAALALVALFGPPSSAGANKVLFRDKFAKPEVSAASWTFYSREARVADGRLWMDGAYKPDSWWRDGWAFTHEGDQAWTDYALEATYDNSVPSDWFPDRWESFFMVRVVAGTTEFAQYDTLYRIDIWPGGQVYEGYGTCEAVDGISVNGWVGLAKNVRGETVALAESCSSNATIGKNDVEISVIGGAIEVISNGETVLTWTDPDSGSRLAASALGRSGR